MSKLEIRGLQVVVNTENGPKEILKGVDLTVNSGETHAIIDRKSTRLNSSHSQQSRMPSSA